MSDELTHIASDGSANMVDVADKDHTTRVAVAESCVVMKLETLELILSGNAAIAGGAGRIELCSSLSEGGLTPSRGLMQAAAKLGVPCRAMIRPRSGLFHFADEDTEVMLADIAAARDAELAGVVLGVQDASGADDGLYLHVVDLRRCQT